MPMSLYFMDGSKRQLPLLLSWFGGCVSTSFPHQLALFRADGVVLGSLLTCSLCEMGKPEA